MFGEAGSGRRLLELGCGGGFCSLAAALAGFDVIATDYYPEAHRLRATERRRNAIPPVATRMVDWRDFPRDLGVSISSLGPTSSTSAITPAWYVPRSHSRWVGRAAPSSPIRAAPAQNSAGRLPASQVGDRAPGRDPLRGRRSDRDDRSLCNRSGALATNGLGRHVRQLDTRTPALLRFRRIRGRMPDD